MTAPFGALALPLAPRPRRPSQRSCAAFAIAAGLVLAPGCAEPSPPAASAPAGEPASEPDTPEPEPEPTPASSPEPSPEPQPVAGQANFHWTAKLWHRPGPPSCDLWAEVDETRELPCHWWLDCGEPRRRHYEGATACELEAGRPRQAGDHEERETPRLEVDFRQLPHHLQLDDRFSDPPRRLLVVIDEGSEGSTDAPVPVPVRSGFDRKSPEEIDALIVELGPPEWLEPVQFIDSMAQPPKP